MNDTHHYVPDCECRDCLHVTVRSLRAHLAGIEKIAANSRSHTKRLQLIAARCRSALDGNNEWRKLPWPRKRHPLATPATDPMVDAITGEGAAQELMKP